MNLEKIDLRFVISVNSLARPKLRSVYKTITNCTHCAKLHALSIFRSNNAFGSVRYLNFGFRSVFGKLHWWLIKSQSAGVTGCSWSSRKIREAKESMSYMWLSASFVRHKTSFFLSSFQIDIFTGWVDTPPSLSPDSKLLIIFQRADTMLSTLESL